MHPNYFIFKYVLNKPTAACLFDIIIALNYNTSFYTRIIYFFVELRLKRKLVY